MEYEAPIHLPDPSRFTFLKALQRALGRTPLWLMVTAFTGLLAVGMALPWGAWYREAIGQRYEPGSLLRSLDETFWVDHRVTREVLETSTSGAGAVLALLAVLMGAFTAGGWLQVFLQRTDGHSLRRFFYGGSRYFFRFLRVLVLTVLSLQLVGFVLYGLPWQLLVEDLMLGITEPQDFVSEMHALGLVWVQDGLYLLGVALVLVWGDYTRTRLAMHDGVSALWAGLCTWVTLIAHPVRTLRPMLLLWLAEVAVLWAAWHLSRFLDARITEPGDWVALLLLFLVGQGILAWRCIVRGARYAAALEISGGLVRAPRRPDPWKESVGGPGGPQYPLGGDEYTVSL